MEPLPAEVIAAPQADQAGGRRELLSSQDLGRTIDRLASQVLERTDDSRALLLLGIPTRGVALARVLAERALRSAAAMRLTRGQP